MKSDDHLVGSVSPLGGLFLITNIALTGCIWDNGGYPSANSIAVIPRDQMSVKLLYFYFEITSGDIQKGVPINDSSLSIIKYLTIFAFVYKS